MDRADVSRGGGGTGMGSAVGRKGVPLRIDSAVQDLDGGVDDDVKLLPPTLGIHSIIVSPLHPDRDFQPVRNIDIRLFMFRRKSNRGRTVRHRQVLLQMPWTHGIEQCCIHVVVMAVDIV